MAKIDELLQELCPDGVDYVKIQEVCVRQKGMNITAQRMCELDNPNGQIKIFAAGSTVAMFNEADVPSQCIIRKPSIIVKSRGNIGFEYCIVPFSHKNEMWSYSAIDNKIDLKYLYHLLLSKIDLFQFIARSNAVKLPQLCVKDTDCYEIPLPPLPIQHYIVDVLDTFTDAISNLEEELALREKQFGFYREQLLSFDDEASLGGKLFSDKVKYVKLKDICLNICSGGTPLTSNKEYYSGSNPWLRTQEVDWNDVYDTELKISEDAIKNSSAKLIPANCLIVAMYGATAGKCCINRIPLTTNQACCNLQIDERQALVKYVFHWVCKEYHHIKSMGEGSQSNLNAQKVKSYPVPLPSISIQKEIVETLDTFEAMIANIKEEIALRTKQYEYYREKLLSFGK